MDMVKRIGKMIGDVAEVINDIIPLIDINTREINALKQRMHAIDGKGDRVTRWSFEWKPSWGLEGKEKEKDGETDKARDR